MSENLEVGDQDSSMNENGEETDFSESTSIKDLPEEMLIKIMGLLPLNDRAQCRLVSRDWHKSCAYCYERKETICITKLYNNCLNEVWSTLSKSFRSTLHLEFYDLDFSFNRGDGDAEEASWKAFGPKVLSLKLNLCQMEMNRTFANIVKYCSGLKTLKFHLCPTDPIVNPWETLGITCLNDVLPLQNTSLQTLNIQFDRRRSYAGDEVFCLRYLHALCQLLSLFPNVSSFSSSHHIDSVLDSIVDEEVCRRNSLTHFDDVQVPGDENYNPELLKCYIAELLKYFGRDQMESIAISWLGPVWDIQTKFMEDLCKKTTKITEIIISDSEDWTMESFLEFTFRQTNIRKVTCIFSKPRFLDEDLEEVMIKFLTFLQHVPKACHLSLIAPYWNENVSVKSFPVLANITSCEIYTVVLVNVDFIFQFLPNLSDFHLMHTFQSKWYSSFSTIMPKLKSFIVNSGSSVITDKKMVSFRNLRYLKVPQNFVLQPFNDFGFNLRSYRFCCDDRQTYFISRHLSVNQFLIRCQMMYPYLEVVRFDLNCDHFRSNSSSAIVDAFANFAAGMKYLKYLYLYVKNGPEMTEEDASIIFQRRRSLLVLVISDDHIFFKHAFRKNVSGEFFQC